MEVTVNGEKMQLVGNPPEVGTEISHFKLFDAQNQRVKTRELLGKPTLFSVVPDINTSVCSLQSRKFNKAMAEYPDVRLITVSTNPINEQKGWCAANDIPNAELLSDYEQSFGYAMKLLIPDEGVLARSIFLIDADGQIVYRQIVPEMTHEPDCLAALNAVEKLGTAAE